MVDANGTELEGFGVAEIEEVYGIDLSSPTAPNMASLEEAQALIGTLWTVSRALLKKGEGTQILQKQKASLRDLLGSADVENVEQGIKLMKAIDDPELWEDFAEGLSITETGVLEIGNGTLRGWLKPQHLTNTALAVARQAGLLDNVTTLCLSETNVSDLTPLKGLKKLTSLKVKRCQALIDLSILEHVPSLTHLDLSNCRHVSHLILGQLTQMTHLNLYNCTSVSDLSGLEGLTNLTSLDLRYCSSVSDLSPLKGLTNLTSLDLRHCRSVSDLSGLEGLTNLTSLDLYNCRSVSDLSPLKGLTNLTYLNVNKCGNIPVKAWQKEWTDGEVIIRRINRYYKRK